MERVLWVDDDQTFRYYVRRALRDHLDVVVAADPDAAMARLQEGSFAVVVADMNMLPRDGLAFLSDVRYLWPDAVRLMCTGSDRIETAAQAINDGAIFRFLRKPIMPEEMVRTIDVALQQYRLQTAEREILEKTLVGSVSALVELLAIIHPHAAARSVRLRSLVHRICSVLRCEEPWKAELAAMLAEIGLVTIPDQIVRSYLAGHVLSDDDARRVVAHPAVATKVLSKIPRLDHVVEIIAAQNLAFGDLLSTRPNDPLRLSKGILRASLEFDRVLQGGLSAERAIEIMNARTDSYDPRVLDALCDIHNLPTTVETISVLVNFLAPGMMLAEDLKSDLGVAILPRGEVVSDATVSRLKNFKVRQLVVKVFSQSGIAA